MLFLIKIANKYYDSDVLIAVKEVLERAHGMFAGDWFVISNDEIVPFGPLNLIEVLRCIASLDGVAKKESVLLEAYSGDIEVANSKEVIEWDGSFYRNLSQWTIETAIFHMDSVTDRE